jgi:hypothetical protein
MIAGRKTSGAVKSYTIETGWDLRYTVLEQLFYPWGLLAAV